MKNACHDYQLKTIILDGNLIKYYHLTKDVKNLRIEVGSGEIVVISPKNASELSFMYKHSQWITKKYAQICNAKNAVKSLDGQFLIFGEAFKVLPKNDFEINFSEKTICMDQSNSTHIKKLKNELKIALYNKIKFFADGYAKKINSRYNKITVRTQKSKWGSYSTNGNMSFNFALAFVPPEVISYIVFHEIAHSRVLRHNTQFWKIVDNEIKNRREIEKSLPGYWLFCNEIMQKL